MPEMPGLRAVHVRVASSRFLPLPAMSRPSQKSPADSDTDVDSDGYSDVQHSTILHGGDKTVDDATASLDTISFNLLSAVDRFREAANRASTCPVCETLQTLAQYELTVVEDLSKLRLLHGCIDDIALFLVSLLEGRYEGEEDDNYILCLATLRTSYSYLSK